MESHAPVDKWHTGLPGAAWRLRRVALGALSALLGGAGEVLLFHGSWQGIGAATLALAALVGAVAWSGITEAPLLKPAESHAEGGQGRRLAWRYAGIAGALLLWWGSMLAWWYKPDAIFGLQGVLWLASMGLLVASCTRWHLPKERENVSHPEEPPNRVEIAIFVGIVLLSLLTRLAWLNDIPWRFQADEAVVYSEAMRFYRGPTISVFTTTWYGTGLPSLPFAFMGGFMHLVGTDLGGVRSLVSLISALTVVPLYGLARLMAGRIAAVLAGLAYATSAVAVHYSRVSIVNMLTPFFWTLCLFILLKGLGSRRPGDFVLSGLAGGLGMYTYYGTRLLPYLLVAYVAYLVIFHFRAVRERAGHLALLALGFLVGFGPLLAYFISNPDMWAGRGLSELTIPPSIPFSWDALVSDWNVLSPLIWKDFLGLSVTPSGDHVYWAALLLPVEAVLALLGTGVLIWRWRQPASFLVLLWGASVLFVGGTLVTQGLVPAVANWTPALPAFYLALAIPPAAMLRSLRSTPKPVYVAGFAFVVAGMLSLAIANAYFYFALYPAQVPPAFESAQGRFLATLTSNKEVDRLKVYFVGDSQTPYSPDIGAMLAPNVPAGDLLNPSRELPLPDADPSHDLIFVFNDDQTQYLPLVESTYPGGQAGHIQTPGGPIGDTYRVSAAQATASHGVLLTLRDTSGREVWSGKVPAPGALPGTLASSFPMLATWSGAFFLRGHGSTTWQIVGARFPARLWVQDEPVQMDVPLTLDDGWIPLRLQALLDAPSELHLMVQQGAGPRTEMDTGRLWPFAPGTGLVVTLKGSGSDAVTHRIDPFVGSGLLTGDLGRAPDLIIRPPVERDPEFIPLASNASVSTIQWDGEVSAEGGQYRMEIRTDAHAILSVDGKTILNIANAVPLTPDIFFHGRFQPISTTLFLTPGWHKVHLDLEATGKLNGIEWAWTRPDGVSGGRRTEIVPPARLRHDVNDK